MAKKRSSKKRTGKALELKTIDLKSLCKMKDERALRAKIEKACESKVAIIVHNAPFALT